MKMKMIKVEQEIPAGKWCNDRKTLCDFMTYIQHDVPVCEFYGGCLLDIDCSIDTEYYVLKCKACLDECEEHEYFGREKCTVIPTYITPMNWKWIKTSDKLPPERESVLIIVDDAVEIGWRLGGDWYFGDLFWAEYPVEYWMPLPPTKGGD